MENVEWNNRFNYALALGQLKTGELDTIKERISEIGIDTLINKDGLPKAGVETTKKLENLVIEHGSKLKTTRIGHSKPVQVQEAINFIEALAFYIADKSISEGLGTPGEKKISEKVFKLTRLLEASYDATKFGKKERVQTFSLVSKRALELFNKLCAEQLTKTEKLAYGKFIQQANEIFKKFK